MRTKPVQKKPVRPARAAAMGALLLLGACQGLKNISSDRLLGLFNEGGTDSFPDLSLTPDEIARERLVTTTRRSLSRSFFSQGQPVESGGVASWFANEGVRSAAHEHINQLRLSATKRRQIDPPTAPSAASAGPAVAPATASAAPSSAPAVKEAPVVTTQVAPTAPGELMGDQNQEVVTFRQTVIDRMALEPGKPLCDRTGLSASGRRIADASRFIAGLELATLDAARMVDEKLVTFPQSRTGLDVAMDEAGRYMHGRRWEVLSEAPTLGIAIKGGASSGTYSAGATWRVLTLMQRYAEHKQDLGQKESAKRARFALASGTSAGAVVAAVVDLFHQDACPIDREATVFRGDPKYKDLIKNDVGTGRACKEYARRLMATVFTCTNQDSLYCIDRKPIWDLASEQMGLMDFRGLRLLMDRHVKEPSLVNSSELVVTTVDFRWGELYMQSDQDPSTVPLDPQAPYGTPEARLFMRRNIEASFVLPFIAHPVDELWVGGERRRGVYLDGGIKSEIPLLALGQRGVDHALVIGSGPTKITPTAPQPNAALIAARYLDISLSAVTEAEWNAMVPYARYVESKERDACAQIFKATRANPLTDEQQLMCDGEYARVCNGPTAPSRRFETLGIFRPESVDPSFGYTFDAVQMRRLFNAGAETIRGRCEEVASFLGIRDVSPELLDTWCNESPIAEEKLCALGAEKADKCEDSIAPALLSCAALVAGSEARAGDEELTPEEREANELDEKERELRDELFREPSGRRSRFATEVELGTQVDWVHRDQHGTLHGGFGFSFSPRQVENLRIASFYAGIAVGQIGDEAHRWVHLETGWRPNFEVPVDSEFKPFLGGRHLVGMSSIGGDDGVDGTLANGASFGVRMLGGLLSVEVHGDAVFSWNREFLVDGERTHWVPRFGFNVKSDFCAFAGGDICEYPAPTPEEIDLSAFMDAALAKLRQGLSPPPEEQCARAEVAVTLRVEKVSPECGVADAAGFFCRFKSKALGPEKSETDDSRLIELARMVHGDLESCYNQSRVDERAAAEGEKQLQRKLRYGAYPPELRTSVCRKSHDEEEKEMAEQAKARQAAASTPEARAKLQKEDEAAAEQRKADSEKLREKVERARYACPRAAKSFDALAERAHELKRHTGHAKPAPR